jgi:hypothetical protein
MSERFRTISLTRWFNSPARLRRGWAKEATERAEHMPRGRQTLWGIPFALGPRDPAKPGLITLGAKPVRVRLSGQATHLCLLHTCNPEPHYWQNLARGEHLADYALIYADGTDHVQPVRRRFEISLHRGMGYRLAAVGEGMLTRLANATTEPASHPDRRRVPRSALHPGSCAENPHPGGADRGGCGPREEPGCRPPRLYPARHPLRHASRVPTGCLPADETKPSEPRPSWTGVILRQYAAPARVDEKWLRAPEAGLGAPRPSDEPAREFLLEATGSPGAMLTVTAGEATHEIPFGDAFAKGKAKSADGRARIELIQPGKTWVHVTVLDGDRSRRRRASTSGASTASTWRRTGTTPT